MTPLLQSLQPLLRPQRTRESVARYLAAACVLSPLARIVTYREWVDGHWVDYGRALAFPLLLAAVAWPLVRSQLVRRTVAATVLPWLAVLGVLAPGDTIHYVRLFNPITLTGQQHAGDSFAYVSGTPSPANWLVEAKPGAAISVKDSRLEIVTPPGVPGFVDLVTPRQPSEVRFETIWQPRGASSETFDELMTWEAAISPSQPFAVVAETRRLVIEAASYGLHLLYRDATDGIHEHTVELPNVPGGALMRYELERKGGMMRLRVNDAQVLVRPDSGRLQFLRFGEVRADPLHGGTLRVSNVQYVRTFDRSAPVPRVPRRT